MFNLLLTGQFFIPFLSSFFMIITKSAGGIVLNSKNQVLIVQQKGNSWSLPKGHLDEGEGALEAAKREIFEESGVSELVLLSELGEYQRFRIGDQQKEDRSEFKTITMFLFRTGQMDLCPRDVDNPVALWVHPHDVPSLLTHPKDQDFFRNVLEGDYKNFFSDL